MTIKTSTRTLLGALLSAGLFASNTAWSADKTFDINSSISGGPDVTVATLGLTQDGSDVLFDLHKLPVTAFGSSSFLSQLDFSYSGSTTLSDNSFAMLSGSTTIDDFDVDPNGKNAGYDFFLRIETPKSNNKDRFLDDEHALWSISDVMVSDFMTAVSGSGPDALALAHIQGLPNGDSHKYVASPITPPVPEAETWAMMLAGLGLIGYQARRKSKARTSA